MINRQAKCFLALFLIKSTTLETVVIVKTMVIDIMDKIYCLIVEC